jgi:hypothetical protein
MRTAQCLPNGVRDPLRPDYLPACGTRDCDEHRPSAFELFRAVWLPILHPRCISSDQSALPMRMMDAHDFHSTMRI